MVMEILKKKSSINVQVGKFVGDLCNYKRYGKMYDTFSIFFLIGTHVENKILLLCFVIK